MQERTLTRWEQMMANYAFYHQQWFNLLTHFIGVPVIVTAVLIPLTWLTGPEISMGNVPIPLNAGLIAVAVLAWYYGKLDRALGWCSVPFLLIALTVATYAGGLGYSTGGTLAAVGFFGGFVLQFIGHAVEGKKPALMAYHPIVAMATSPLFIVAEVAVRFGIRREMFARVAHAVAEREMTPSAA